MMLEQFDVAGATLMIVGAPAFAERPTDAVDGETNAARRSALGAGVAPTVMRNEISADGTDGEELAAGAASGRGNV